MLGRRSYTFVGGTSEPGGVHQHTAQVALALAASGHPTTILSTSVDYFSALVSGSEVRVFQLPVPEPWEARGTRAAALDRYLAPFASASTRAVLLRGSGGQTPSDELAALGRRFTSIFAIEHRVPDAEPFAGRPVAQSVVERSIAVSAEVARALVEDLGFDRSRVVTCPNWVDIDRFRPDGDARVRLREVLGARDDELVIGCVGRLAPEKRIDSVLHALADAPEAIRSRVRLAIVGDGWKRSELEALTEELGIAHRVAYVGWLPDPVSHLQAMDAIVVAGFLEGHPLVLLEAMACGCVPLAHSGAGVAATLRHQENGLVADLQKPQDLAALLGEFVSMTPERRGDLGRAARASVESDFSLRRRLPPLLRALEAPEAAAAVERGKSVLTTGAFLFGPAADGVLEFGDEAPLVSVIVPTHNRASLLARAIDSVRAQSYSRWEVVIADDRSTDTTADLVAGWAREDSRIRYVPNRHRRGSAGARNEAIALARGGYAAFLDSDDFWLPNKLQRMIAFAMANPAARLVGSDYFMVDEEAGTREPAFEFVDRMVAYWLADPVLGRIMAWDSLRRDRDRLADRIAVVNQVIGGFLWLHTSSVVVEMQALREAGGFDERRRRTEDMRLWLRLNLRHRFGVVDEPLATYDISGRDRVTGRRYAHHSRRFRHTRLEEVRHHWALCAFLEEQYVLDDEQRLGLAHLRARLGRDALVALRRPGAASKFHGYAMRYLGRRQAAGACAR